MKLFNRTILFISVLMIGTAGSWADPKHDMGTYTGSREFEKIKSLAGHWEGLSTEMAAGQKTPQTVTVDYRVSSGGSVVIETLFAGTPHEMVSVYHDKKGELAMTHYCMMMNQPELTLSKSVNNEISLEVGKNSTSVDPKSEHMHALVITMPSQTQLVQKWTSYKDGKAQSSSTFNFTKKG